MKPSEVRLKFGEEEAQYAWKFNDKNLEPLFEKHLSKHSVGAYMQLHREAGKGFCAVDPKDIPKVFHYLHNVFSGILWLDTDWARTTPLNWTLQSSSCVWNLRKRI